MSNKKEGNYQANGLYTFFIPVEDGFKVRANNVHFNHIHSKRNDNHFVFHLQPHPRPEMIDRKVIDGHVIPNKVIFTAAAPIEQPFNTLAFEDNVKVTITFFTQGEGKTQKSN